MNNKGQDDASNERQRIKRRDVLLSGGSLLAASTLMGEALDTATSKAAYAQASTTTSTALHSNQMVKSPQTPISTPIRLSSWN